MIYFPDFRKLKKKIRKEEKKYLCLGITLLCFNVISLPCKNKAKILQILFALAEIFVRN